MNAIYLKQIIEKAIKDHSKLKIDFVSTYMKISKDRIIEPLEIVFKNDAPDYVIAKCLLRNEIRNFKLDGIQKIEVLQ